MAISEIAYPNDVQQTHTHVLAKINALVYDVRKDTVPTDVSERVSDIEKSLAKLTQYANMMNHQATATYESISDVGDTPTVGGELAAARQRFETTAHLAKQSRSAYLRQRKIMWLWVMFAVVLGGCLVYMYIWITGLGAAAETGASDHSIASLPDKRELFDSDIMKPSALFDADDANDAAEDADGGEPASALEKASRKFSRMFSKREDAPAVEADGTRAKGSSGLSLHTSNEIRGDGAKNEGEFDSDSLFGDVDEKSHQ